MNPLNYATLEASRRLVAAGIVLETEWYFHIFDGEIHLYTAEQKRQWEEEVKRGDAGEEAIFVPNPCMAEVWRELPQDFFYKKMCCSLMLWKFNKGENTEAGYWWHDEIIKSFLSANPVDALIDLLIWVRNEEGRK